MREEKSKLLHKSIFLNWLKTKIDGLSKEDESEHVQLECSLIRAISEYREKELGQMHLSKDFDLRLMNRLETVEMEVVETYRDGSTRRYRMPLVFSAGFAVLAVAISTGLYFSESSSPTFTKYPATVTPLDLKENSFEMSAEQRALLQELRKNPENVKIMEKLESYYYENGRKEQATEIHSLLETVS